MLHRSARALVQHTPSYSRTAATTAAKRPAYTPRPRTSPASSSSPAAPTPPAAPAPAAAPAYRRTAVPRAAPAAAATAPASTTSPATPLAASEPAAVQAAPPAPAAQPASPLAAVDALPAGPAMGSSQPVGSADALATVTTGPEVDWATSYHGLSAVPFTREQADVLMRPLEEPEIEIKPDGLLYLPEILYRRILNRAFGPGGWGMVPRGEMSVLKNMVTREWGLVAGGRLVSVARGEQTFFDPSGVPTASEGCKSNALMRCCKDLGIASELWDPVFIRAFKKAHCIEAWTEHVVSKKKQKRWRKKKLAFEYPYQEAAR
ncbi:hypothetical protein JCM9279_005599 [Rhodotorula babjevae]